MSEELWHLTKKWCSQQLSGEAKNFLKWDDKAGNPAEEKAGSAAQRINVLTHNGLQIEVGTIHSVKGQTHSATLVLETYLKKKYDLEQLLPYIKGESDASEISIPDEVKEHMKRIFVGGTRLGKF